MFITSRVARGLAYAHAKTDKDGKPLGIVHRDVSFKNIMIAFEGDVKLTDFGIAKARGFLTDQEGEVVAGKADYMSPEQADFQITDKRSDLFSAGVVLAHLLLGRNIFKGADRRGIPPAHHEAGHPGFPHARHRGSTTGSTRFCSAAWRATSSQRYRQRRRVAVRAGVLHLPRRLRPDERDARQVHPRVVRPGTSRPVAASRRQRQHRAARTHRPPHAPSSEVS